MILGFMRTGCGWNVVKLQNKDGTKTVVVPVGLDVPASLAPLVLPEGVSDETLDFFCRVYAGFDMSELIAPVEGIEPRLRIFAEMCAIARLLGDAVQNTFFNMFYVAAATIETMCSGEFDVFAFIEASAHAPPGAVREVAALAIGARVKQDPALAMFPLLIYAELVPADAKAAREMLAQPDAACLAFPHVQRTLEATSMAKHSLDELVRRILTGREIAIGETLDWPWGALYGTSSDTGALFLHALARIVETAFFSRVLVCAGAPVTAESLIAGAQAADRQDAGEFTAKACAEAHARFAKEFVPLLVAKESKEAEWFFEVFSPFIVSQTRMLEHLSY